MYIYIYIYICIYNAVTWMNNLSAAPERATLYSSAA